MNAFLIWTRQKNVDMFGQILLPTIILSLMFAWLTVTLSPPMPSKSSSDPIVAFPGERNQKEADSDGSAVYPLLLHVANGSICATKTGAIKR